MTVMIKFLLAVMLVLIVGIIIIYSYLAYRYQKEQRIKAIIEDYTKKHFKAWFNHFIYDAPITRVMLPIRGAEHLAIERIFLSFLKQYKNNSVQQKISSFMDRYEIAYYEKQLKSKNWSDRLNAIYRISDFQIHAIVPAYNCQKLAKLNVEERVEYLKMYAAVQPENLNEYLIHETTQMEELDYKQIFTQLHMRAFHEVVLLFPQLKPNAQYAVIEMIALQQKNEYENLLRGMLLHENQEVRIRVLKAFEKMFFKLPFDELATFLQSAIWEERLIATRLLKYYALEFSEPYFEQLVTDDHHYVRNEAFATVQKIKNGAQWLAKRQALLNTEPLS
jgi:hypothetical protein